MKRDPRYLSPTEELWRALRLLRMSPRVIRIHDWERLYVFTHGDVECAKAQWDSGRIEYPRKCRPPFTGDSSQPQPLPNNREVIATPWRATAATFLRDIYRCCKGHPRQHALLGRSR